MWMACRVDDISECNDERVGNFAYSWICAGPKHLAINLRGCYVVAIATLKKEARMANLLKRLVGAVGLEPTTR